jgi:hypothetical protein
MRKSLKAALLSALVYPGVGQLWLKHVIRGMAWIAVVSVALAVLVTKAAQQALSILERVESEGATVDLVAIAHAARASSSGDAAIRYATLALMLCWLGSIVDAYYLGRGKDLQTHGGPKALGEPPAQKRTAPRG